jgi:hypothetical protein
VTPESAALRASIRQGHVNAALDREEFDFAVSRVYELERAAEAMPMYLHTLLNWRAP